MRFYFLFSAHLSAGCLKKNFFISCQEEQVMGLVLSPSPCCLSEADGLVHRTKKNCFIVITENMSSANLTKLKEFPPTMYDFKRTLYDS